MKPYLKLAGAFMAGFIACLIWQQMTANRYTIVNDTYGRKMRINQRNGETWIYTGGQWSSVAER